MKRIDFRTKLFSQRRSSLFREFLSCLHLSTRSSSSSITNKQFQTGRISSFSQYQSIGALVNTDTNLSQVKIDFFSGQTQSSSWNRSSQILFMMNIVMVVQHVLFPMYHLIAQLELNIQYVP